MKPLLTLTLVAFLLMGCSFFKKSAEPTLAAPVVLPVIPVELRACDRPVPLTGSLGASQAVRLWSQDRYALVECRANLNATHAFYDDLTKRLNKTAAQPAAPH